MTSTSLSVGGVDNENGTHHVVSRDSLVPNCRISLLASLGSDPASTILLGFYSGSHRSYVELSQGVEGRKPDQALGALGTTSITSSLTITRIFGIESSTPSIHQASQAFNQAFSL